MNYENYFDSLFDKSLYTEKEEIFSVLSKEYENESVRSYHSLDDLVFEILLALEEKNDFAAIIELQNILGTHYQEAYDAEYGRFAEVLIPYYISKSQNREAKSLFDKWIEKDYDYDAMLVFLNRLAHYGKESWVDEFIEKEYHNIKVSPKLIPGAERDLVVYKVIIEIGKLNEGSKNLDEIIQTLARYDIELSALHKKTLTIESELTFRKEQEEFVFQLVNGFQKYLYSTYDIPYLQSGIIISKLGEYYENSKYKDVVTYFKIHEKSFEIFMDDNSVNGLSFNKTSNFAMLYLLPVFFQYLTEQNIFTPADRNKEKEKVANLLKTHQQQDPEGPWVLDELESYKLIKSVLN